MATIAASADIPDELTMFNDLEKETLKLDRSILQQNETTERLKKIKEKLERKKEKEKLRSANFENQLKSLLNANKMSKENLKTKRESRCMSEEMVSNLERQLQLEKIDAENKVKSFMLTQKKYEDIWKNYESVYFNMPHVVSKFKAEKDLEAANELIGTMRSDVGSSKAKIAKAHVEKDLQITKCALLIAKHKQVQKVEKDVVILRKRKEELAAEVAKLEIDVKNSQTKKATEEIEQNQRKSRIRNLMNSLNDRTSELQIMEFSHMAMEQSVEPQSSMLDPMTLFDIEEKIGAQSEIPVNRTEEIQEDFSSVQDTYLVSRDWEQEQQTSAPPPKRHESVTAAPRQECNIIEESVEDTAMETTASEVANAPSSKGQRASNKSLAKAVVVPQEIPNTAPVVEQLPPEPAPAVLASAEPMSEEESEAGCSQTTMAPEDMQVDQQQILGASSQQELSNLGLLQSQPIAPIPTPVWDESGSEGTGEVLSQGTTVSSTGSVINLLDDEKRAEFMRKLMTTPTFSIPMADLPNGEEVENDPSTSSRSSANDQACLQNFYALLAEGTDATNAMPVEANKNAPAIPTVPFAPPQPQVLQAPVQVAVNPATPVVGGDDSDKFLFPATSTPTPNATGFGGFGNFFGSAPAQNSTSSFFGSAFGEAPAGNAASQPANSGFAFNFGASSTPNQSFMNLF